MERCSEDDVWMILFGTSVTLFGILKTDGIGFLLRKNE